MSQDNKELSKEIRNIIDNYENTFYTSIYSIHEIAILHKLNKIKLKVSLSDFYTKIEKYENKKNVSKIIWFSLL
ncbi:MAG: hypothetical protein SNJ71_00230 [Bacteroidales bacterium]